MKTATWRNASSVLGAFVFAWLALPTLFAGADYTLDRWYRLGDDPSEGAFANSSVSITYDSSGLLGQSPSQLADLEAIGSPLYVDISGDRPHANATLDNYAISFDGATQYLHGPNLNIPYESTKPNFSYTGTDDRGYQLWFKINTVSDAYQHMLDDGDEHSAIITPAGDLGFEMRSNDGGQASVGSQTAAVANEWVHYAQIRPDGANGGALGYINGLAAVSQSAIYDSSSLELAIAADAEDDTLGGTAFTPSYNGLISDIEMFVFGEGYGDYSYTTDNGYFTDVFLPSTAGYSYTDSNQDGHNDNAWIAGDINFDGQLNVDDVMAFIAGWNSDNAGTINGNGPSFGDYQTLGLGDLDLDGDTDVDDWLVLRATGVTAGVGSLSDLLEGATVPEPTSLVLLAAGLFAMACYRSRV
ncbi:LamG-like jellyroll fold domain-containing protein [Aeoliella mucimassa]|uniref:PEP-CTERM motif protein n=1 Tax=Aeoliella mucimassa TaxID=2527972 RepID=A0A518AUI1_9BACT|nr:LamG-like jellyroll fold domain-containing protein [Aeoliella mucimassa]QDU58383.1 PEP-CTERM motif protein [Aeoliella mucimassa]